jgi:integrator complex subunit 11
VDEELEIKAYYAGHVLGAAMVHVKVGTQSFVYTGDYNMTPDRHLGAAWIDRCRPDLLISESTYATTIRDSKKCREHDFLKKVHDCIDKGGKVLIPVFALGRAQELFILLESYWDRMNLDTPIYFTVGLASKANQYYKLFITWTNQKLLSTFVERNLFDFKHIKQFDKSYTDQPGPMVVFATPGMLHSGQSLQIFKKWANDEKNMLIMPGYCVAGTVGHKVLSGQKEIEIDKKMISVKMSIQYMSFSAHADAKGIMQLIRMCEPKNVLLVHGEAVKMKFLSKKINQEFGIDCFMPANGETVAIAAPPVIMASISGVLLKRTMEASYSVPVSKRPHHLPNMAELHGLLVAKDDKLKLIDPSEAEDEVGMRPHQVVFCNTLSLDTHLTEKCDVMDKVYQNTNKMFPQLVLNRISDTDVVFDGTSVKISVQGFDGKFSKLEVSWNYSDDVLGENVWSLLQRSLPRVLSGPNM